jgi:polyhydroxybutyrate depolymerase
MFPATMGVTAMAVAAMVLAACSTSERSRATSPSPRSTTPARTRGPDPSEGCGREDVAKPGVFDRTLTSMGVERQFELRVPSDYDGVTPLPVVLGLHPLTVSYKAVAALSGFDDVSPAYDFIGVMPSGLVDGSIPYWLAAPAPDNHDVAYISDLVDVLASELCIDRSGVYSTGMSNGAQMSSLLACRLSDRIAAIAVIAGVEYFEPCRGRPVPVLAFHGTADPFVPYGGGGLDAVSIADDHYWKGDVPSGLPNHRGVDAAMRLWAAHNRCDARPVEQRISPGVRKRSWRGCAATTTLYIVDGGGHTWPGRPVPGFNAFGPTTEDIEATALMFEFFFKPKR